jgi:heme/copper-type cytochrome/quinol oxidase subunit 2
MLRAVADARSAQRRMRSLARLNLELAKLEGQQKATATGIAVALAGAAALVFVYTLGFGFGALAAALDLVVSLWAALLIVAGITLLIGAILVLMAVRYARRAWPPQPLQAIEEGERTIETVKNHA